MEKIVTVGIVDDDKTTRQLLTFLLGKAGCQIEFSVGDGHNAVTRYNKQPVNILLLDIDMPTMNGIEALKEIKKSDNHVYAVMVSSTNHAEVVKEALAAGASDYILKPFSIGRIHKMIETYRSKMAKAADLAVATPSP
ncbi:MAG: response regulator [Gammaproteobacteria bacterium]|nr:response regulator [Gammaproteobacteria bacterium]